MYPVLLLSPGSPQALRVLTATPEVAHQSHAPAPLPTPRISAVGDSLAAASIAAVAVAAVVGRTVAVAIDNLGHR
jgi:hypothetical protein